MEIQDAGFDSVLTIVFLNKSHNPPTQVVWVCENREAYTLALFKLGELEHVQIVSHGRAHVERAAVVPSLATPEPTATATPPTRTRIALFGNQVPFAAIEEGCKRKAREHGKILFGGYLSDGCYELVEGDIDAIGPNADVYDASEPDDLTPADAPAACDG